MASSDQQGEKPDVRRAMEDMRKHLQDHGMKPQDAEKKARDLARDWDRRNR